MSLQNLAHPEPFWGPRTWGGRLNTLAGGLICGIVGAFTFSVGVWTIWLAAGSTGWVETPATILHHMDEDVRYSYESAGRVRESSRVTLWDGYVSGAPGPLKIPAAGTVTRAWVNPRKPEEAVLTRSFLPASLMAICFSLPWLTIATLKLLAALVPRALARVNYRRWFQAVPQLVMEKRLPSWIDAQGRPPRGVYSLREARSRGWEVRVLLAAFMTGLSGCALASVLPEALNGGTVPAWMWGLLTVFLGLWIAFVLLPGWTRGKLRRLPVYFVAVEEASAGMWTVSWSLEPGQPAPRSLRLSVVERTGYTQASGEMIDWWRARALQKTRGAPAKDPDWDDLAVVEVPGSQLEHGSAVLNVPDLEPELLEANLVTLRVRMEDARGLWGEDEIVLTRTWAGLG